MRQQVLESERARYLCAKYMPGVWRRIQCEEFRFQPLSGGLSNYLFLCSLDPSVEPQSDEPTRVLIRVFGQILSQNAESVVLDSVIFALLSEKRMGPRLFGVFNGGRIEEFVPNSAPLKREQLLEPDVHLTISKHMARLHRLEMPLCKEPRFLFKLLGSWLKQLSESQNQQQQQQQQPGFNNWSLERCLAEFNLIGEFEWLKDAFYNQYNFPVVFCHNDLQENNILYFEDKSSIRGFSLQLIDFEYCSYNWRGFDVGNFFNEWAFDYTSKTWPYFGFHPEDYPDRRTQLQFWRSYLRWYSAPELDTEVPAFPSGSSGAAAAKAAAKEATAAASPDDGSCAEPAADEEADEEALLLEAKFGAALSHLFWGVWSLVQASMSTIQFDYKEYAIARLRLYQEMKRQLPSG